MLLKVTWTRVLPYRGRSTTNQLLRTMKITSFLLLATCLQVYARGYTQISLTETNAPLQKIFRQLQKQSGYDFFYPYELVEQAGRVTVKLRNLSLG